MTLEVWANRVLDSVPNEAQSTSYSCGPAVLVSVLQYFGLVASESTLMAEAGTTPEGGTQFEDMARVLKKHGLKVEPKTDLDPSAIKRLLSQSALVVIGLQAWTDELPPLGGYSSEWNAGHYVVPVAVDKDTILFQDPAVAGRRSFLTHEEFAKRWHEADAGGVYPRGFGLVVRGNGPTEWRKGLGRLAPPIRMG